MILEGSWCTDPCEENPLKAIIQDKYGPPLEVLSLQEIDMPVIKQDHEVLVRVHTAAVHAGDWLLMSGQPPILRLMFGLRKPRKKIPGLPSQVCQEDRAHHTPIKPAASNRTTVTAPQPRS